MPVVRSVVLSAGLISGGLIASGAPPVGNRAVNPSAAADAVITLDPSVTYQTMRGWEATAYAGPASFDPAAAGLFDRAAEIGINRIRLEVRAGAEHATDNYAAWKAAGFPDSGPSYQTWRARRYETVNDNNDPGVADPAGYHFTELDDIVERIVNPFRIKLAARNERLYVNLTYVAFTGQVTSSQPYVHNNPAEYAEFMLVAFTHIQQKYGWVPDGIEVILEPDNVSQWKGGALIGQTIVGAGQRLAANGFTPDFIGPSTTCMGNAISYLDQMLSVAGVTNYLKEVSYHRYCQVSTANLEAIALRARQSGLSTSMLEWWNPSNDRDVLHQDLKVGLNSAWQLGGLAGTSGVDLFQINGSTLAVGSNTRYAQQYFKYVRHGAKRIGSNSSQAVFDPVAFINTNGSYGVITKAASGGSFSVTGLPAGTYGMRYTTSSSTDVALGDQSVRAGESLTASIPAAGVVAIFYKAATGPVVTGRRRPASVPATGFAIPRPRGNTSTGAVQAMPTASNPAVTTAPAYHDLSANLFWFQSPMTTFVKRTLRLGPEAGQPPVVVADVDGDGIVDVLILAVSVGEARIIGVWLTR